MASDVDMADLSLINKKQPRTNLSETCEDNARKVLVMESDTPITVLATPTSVNSAHSSNITTPTSDETVSNSQNDKRAQDGNINERVVSSVECLLSLLPGRTWTGKESVLEALSAICVSAVEQQYHVLLPAELVERVVDALLAEAAKSSGSVRYRISAIRCVGRCLNGARLNRQDAVCTLTDNVLNNINNGNSTDGDCRDWLKASLQAMSDAFTVVSGQSSLDSVKSVAYSVTLLQRCLSNADFMRPAIVNCLSSIIESYDRILNTVEWRDLLANREYVSLYSDSIRGLVNMLTCLVRTLSPGGVRDRAISTLLSANVAILRRFGAEVTLLNDSLLVALCAEIITTLSDGCLQECITSVANLQQLNEQISQFTSLISCAESSRII